MNLIEQLGGYEKAKEWYDENTDKEWVGIYHMPKLYSALLEYRRENNIFEVGDSFVFLDGNNPEIMTVQFVWDDAVWGGYCGEIPKNSEIRHTYPEEIKVGHRL